jgi:plastocyanin
MTSGQRKVRRTGAGVVTAVVVILAVGCQGSPSATPSLSARVAVAVNMEDSTFVPPGGDSVDGVPAVTIPVGTTVTWTNNDAIDHTASEYEHGFVKPDARFDIELPPGASGSHTFTETGTVEVGCVPHPHMQMLVIVEEPGS